MKIRIKFRKNGVMKFVGHLDVMRYFQKAIRRADIDICYSGGFSPHQIMSFAAPLGVGLTSDGEYFDIEAASTRSTDESIAALNGTMVEGMEVTGYRLLPDTAKPAMSIVAAADYELYFKEGYAPSATAADFAAGIERYFFLPEEYWITKQKKDGEARVDVKHLVYAFSVEEREGAPCFLLRTCTGSTDNLKPEPVLSELFEKMGLACPPGAIQIHRKDIYTQGFVSLGETGESIL